VKFTKEVSDSVVNLDAVGVVDMADLILLVNNWLEQVHKA